MLKTIYLKTRSDNVILVKTYSTDNKYIMQVETGLEYNEAIDVGVFLNGEYMPLHYRYIELDKEIEREEEENDTNSIS